MNRGLYKKKMGKIEHKVQVVIFYNERYIINSLIPR